MTYLLDTCIVLKLRKLKTHPEPLLERWILQHSEDVFYISVVTLGEIQAGISKLNLKNPEQKRFRMLLEDWLFGELIPRFQQRILDITTQIALSWGTMTGQGRQNGNTVPVADGLIAATAMHHSLIVVTDNSKHFTPSGVEMINPWLVC